MVVMVAVGGIGRRTMYREKAQWWFSYVTHLKILLYEKSNRTIEKHLCSPVVAIFYKQSQQKVLKNKKDEILVVNMYLFLVNSFLYNPVFIIILSLNLFHID